MATKNFLPSGKNPTPFNPTLEHFDLICGHLMSVNRMYKFVATISALAFFLSIAITMYAVSRPDSIPVLVTMNDFGEARYIGPVSRRNWQNYSIPELAVQFQIKEFISLYHTLSTDKTVMRKSVSKIYHMLTAITAAKYSSLVKEENPFEHFGEHTREVLFETEPLRLSTDTYQMDYHVITRYLTGHREEDTVYRAVISAKTLQPSDEDIKDNPLGIYITAFDMKQVNTVIRDKE